MNKYQRIVNNVIEKADVILFILDARMVEETRNIELEERVKEMGKPLIYVITKSDLIKHKDQVEKFKKILTPCVFISSTAYHGVNILRERIMIEANKAKVEFPVIRVGTVGYPNVGKSSLINAMTGRSSASTSMMSGHTKGMQKIKSSSIMFLDAPGVIPPKENDQEKHAMIGSIDFTKTKNPDLAVMRVMEEYPGKIEEYYGVEISDDFEETIEKIAIKKKILMKGNLPDIDRMARAILKNWQTGKIK